MSAEKTPNLQVALGDLKEPLAAGREALVSLGDAVSPQGLGHHVSQNLKENTGEQ